MNGKNQHDDSKQWSWVRVYYYDDCKDDLILDGIWPALCDTAPVRNEPAAFFRRDWIRGPNVLIALKRSAEPQLTPETPVIAEIRGYLQKHPSHSALSAKTFKSLMRPYGTWELQQQYTDVDLEPNNSIFIERSEPYSPMIEDAELKEALRRFQCDTSILVVRWLELIRTGMWERQHIALIVLIALIWVAEPEELRSHLSFRSHAEGFFGGSDTGPLLRAQFSAHYLHERENMLAFMESTIDQLRRGNCSLPGISNYIELVRRILSELTKGLRQRRFRPPKVAEIVWKLALGNPQLVKEFNDRYAKLFVHLDINAAVRAWQISVNLIYLMLNQLGLRPLERFLACYLVTRTAEDLYGHKASDLAEMMAVTGDVSRIFSFARQEDVLG